MHNDAMFGGLTKELMRRRTGSVWVGYNFSAGKKLVLNVTPMIGGVFGRTTGVGPGCELSLSYWKLKM